MESRKKLKIKTLGIYREKYYSNRAIDADAMIMDSVIGALDKSKFEVVSIINPVTTEIPNGYDLYITMAQGLETLKQLDQIESKGGLVINNTTSIRNCFRSCMSRLFKRHNINAPEEFEISTSNDDPSLISKIDLSSGYWVKRGDYHSVEDADVVFVNDIIDYHQAKNRLLEKGIQSFILQKHIDGDIVKFYGVSDSFFTLRQMGSSSQDRLALGKIKTSNQHINIAKLKASAFKVAAVFGLDFYGGDFIVTENGDFYLIDINDWPSFRTCYESVTPYMANVICKKWCKFRSEEIKCPTLSDYELSLVKA